MHLLIGTAALIVAILPIYIAFKRGCPSRVAIGVAVVVSLELLPISIMSGGAGSLARYGVELLMIWWAPALFIWFVALICACLEKSGRGSRGFEVLAAGQTVRAEGQELNTGGARAGKGMPH